MKNLLLSLIKDDLVHTRLLNGLSELGFDTADYYQNLNEAIFSVAGFSHEQVNDELREWYFSRLEGAQQLSIPPRSCPAFEALATGICVELEWKRANETAGCSSSE